ncbi:hypothetical protein GCM10027285_26240 [Oleiagrimonas citrea]
MAKRPRMCDHRVGGAAGVSVSGARVGDSAVDVAGAGRGDGEGIEGLGACVLQAASSDSSTQAADRRKLAFMQ